jgi:quercetin dioxygenase-like cupin family protein
MKRSISLALAAAAAITLSLATAASVSGQTPPAITPRYTSNYTNVQPPGRYIDLQMTISEFDPGASSPANNFTSVRYVTVVEGAVRVTIGSETKDYATGTNFVIPGGAYVKISNAGTTKAQIFLSSLRVAGTTAVQSLPPGEVIPALLPRVVATGTLPGIQVPTTGVTVQQAVQDWQAGAKNSPHMMNHPHLYVTLGGENTVKYLDGTTTKITSGQSGTMTPGKPGIMENTGTTTARMYFAWVLTPGTPNTSPVTGTAATISPPSTGDAGLEGSGSGPGLGFVAAAAAALLALAAVRGLASVIRR